MQIKLVCNKAVAPSALVFVVIASTLSAPARSQTGALPAPVDVNSALGQAPPPRTLADILDKIAWDTQTRGTLLIISPEDTTIPVRRRDPNVEPIPPLEPDVAGFYRMTQVEASFDRRIVPLRSLSVLAPATMVVLNTDHFPPPNPYAGMAPDAKVRLLLSTLTPDQWQTIGSRNGIGAADLNRDQRELFLSMLPDPFRVGIFNAGYDASGKYFVTPESAPRELSPDERADVRLSIGKSLTWGILEENGRGSAIMGSDPTILGRHLRMTPTGEMPGVKTSSYGALIREVVPSRSKLSQLPYDYSGYEVTVSLRSARTVADVVRVIAAATRSELYCDPRYADLKVAVFGSSARAGDALHALAWAVTGTWRRLGDAFVLTDDLVGLGTRHALISDWIDENAVLHDRREVAIDRAIAEMKPGGKLGWSSESMRPGAALEDRLEAFENGPGAPGGVGQLTVSVTDLPQAARAMIRQQAEDWIRAPNSGGPGMPARTPVRTDKVLLDEQANAAFVIPGLGSADANELVRGQFRTPLVGQVEHLRYGMNAAAAAQPAKAPAISIPQDLGVRALIVKPLTETDVKVAAQGAHDHGFSELWVDVARGQQELLAAAVLAGRANGLSVRPMIRLLHADDAEPAASLDTNILGETTTGHARWWTAQLAATAGDDPAHASPKQRFDPWAGIGTEWTNAQAVSSLIKGGDFVRCDEPAGQTGISTEVARTASVSGIAGIVLSHTRASGYDGAPWGWVPYNSLGANLTRDPLLQMGYSLDMRLAFLRANGVDPIDLSPLFRGDHIGAGPSGEGNVSLELPFFRDYGTGAASEQTSNAFANTIGVKDAFKKWFAFRHEIASAAIDRSLVAIKAAAPAASVIIRHETDSAGVAGPWYGSIEPPDAAASPGLAATVSPGVPRKHAPGPKYREQGEPWEPTVRTVAKGVYYTVGLPANAPGATAAKAALMNRLAKFLAASGSWDGLVVDLSSVPVSDALEVIHEFTAAPAFAITVGAR